ncbi:MAG: rhamnogalacturonan acetylesterase [Verrucomicrobia bacterium]|nr:rhamnogalacturonan acetylesterase [Verrucomicrobiota bacterium]
MPRPDLFLLSSIVGLLVSSGTLLHAAEPAARRFTFGHSAVATDIVVAGDTLYTLERGFGFEPGATITANSAGTGVESPAPFYFTAAVPTEGNYRVTVTFPLGADATVKAELRRLVVERVTVPVGQSAATRTFIVNTRTPAIASRGDIKAGVVKLKAPRETVQEAWAWDNALTLEFTGAHPAVSTIEIAPVNVPTIFLIGDSTVCDQSKEPYNSWGQMLTNWFKPEVAIANHGESGETYRDSIGRRRLDKMLSVMQPGDWMLMQFGHNDQKQLASNSGGPFTTYKEELKKHVDAVRAHGGTPIILSPMERRGFDEAGKVRPSLAEYAEAARQSAKELNVAFIDLNAFSKPFYEALESHGPEFSRKAFAGQDNTHHSNYGSYELSKAIVQSILDQKLPLAKFVVADFKPFDPAHPDDVAAFAIPASPNFSNQRPLGDETNK